MLKTLQSTIRYQRKLKALTQEEVAKALKMKRSTYAVKEANGDFDITELKKLSRIIGLSSDALESLDKGEGSLIRNPQEYMLQAIIRIEAMMRVNIKITAERLAKEANRPLKEVLLEVEKRVNFESSQSLRK